MANTIITADSISVHGRGSLQEQYKVRDANGNQIDISSWVIRFEVDGLVDSPGFSTLLVADPQDALGKLLILTRTQVNILNKETRKFALVDETNLAGGAPRVLWEGTIKRHGFAVLDGTEE